MTTFDVSALAESIIAAAKSRGKIAREFRALAESAYADADKQAELSVTLGQIRGLVSTRSEAVAKRLPADDRDAFKKAVLNQLGYAAKVAGDTAGCLFKYDQKSKTYSVADKPAANEKPAPSAAGKDANSAAQAADLVAAATVAPEQSKAQRMAHLDGVLRGLIQAGYSMAEVEAAFHAAAMALGKARTDAEVTEAAQQPQAPAILADKLAQTVAAKGQAKPAQRKRTAKAA